MKVHELIDYLRKCNQEAEVRIVDMSVGDSTPIASISHDDNDEVLIEFVYE